MRRLPILAALAAVPVLGMAAEWAEVAAPGRKGDGIRDATGSHERSVEALVPFDGRLYPCLPPDAGSNRQGIAAFDPVKMDLVPESPSEAIRFGRLRVLGGRLHAPVAEPAGATGGYCVSAGKGVWEWVPVTTNRAAFYDIARFDNATFLAGRAGDQAIAAWRRDGETAWRIEPLTAQAARFSYKAHSFLTLSNRLALLAVRDVVGEWPNQVAPRDWGAWYLLAYCPTGSVRGFTFDGFARPLPSLRRLASDSSILQNPRYAIGRDVPWKDGLLYITRREADAGRDPQGGLFQATLEANPPPNADPLAARRIPGFDKARDIAVAADRVAVLLGDDTSAAGEIRVSRDLEQWETVFAGEFPGVPISLAVLDGRYYVGLDNGGIIRMAGP